MKLIKSLLLAGIAVAVTASGQPVLAQGAGIEGRWTHYGDCGNWVQFTRRGSSWTYAEVRLMRGQPQAATVSTKADGSVLVVIDDYEYVIRMNGGNSFNASEGPVGGPHRANTYTRCS